MFIESLFLQRKDLYYFSFVPALCGRGSKAGVLVCRYFFLGMDWGIKP